MTIEEKRAKERAKQKAWRDKNPEKVRAANKKNRAKNGWKWREKERLAAKAWRDSNIEYARARELAYSRSHKAEKCAREKARRLANPEKKRATNREYRKKNPEKMRELAKAYAEKNRDKLCAKYKEHYRKNKMKHLAYGKARYAAKYVEIRAKQNAYSKTEHCRKLDAARHKRLMQTSPQYRIAMNIRGRIKKCFARNYRSGSSLALLGCSVAFAKAHLEALFKPGMTWENYGLRGWHIDHIIPLSSADLTNPESVKKLCHYTNLQPLWAKENLRKYNHIAAAGECPAAV